MSSFSSLLDQSIYTVPSFTLESGKVLKQAPVAYKTWGKLNDAKDNVMIICHAFTGSADVEDWLVTCYGSFTADADKVGVGGAHSWVAARPSTRIDSSFSAQTSWDHPTVQPLQSPSTQIRGSPMVPSSQRRPSEMMSGMSFILARSSAIPNVS